MNAPPGLVQPVPLRFLLDDTMREARRSFRAIYPSVALPMAVAAALLGFAQRFIQPIPGGATRPPLLPGLDGFLAFAAAVVAFMAVYSVCYMALLAAAADAHYGRGVRMARAWAFVFRPAAIGTVVLGLGAAALATTCCILPGVYVSLVFALAGPLMIEEGRFGPGALMRSAALMSWNPRGVLRDGDREPRGVRGHLPAARGPARPLPPPDRDAAPGRGRGDRGVPPSGRGRARGMERRPASPASRERRRGPRARPRSSRAATSSCPPT
jgi:hypothetical protein